VRSSESEEAALPPCPHRKPPSHLTADVFNGQSLSWKLPILPINVVLGVRILADLRTAKNLENYKLACTPPLVSALVENDRNNGVGLRVLLKCNSLDLVEVPVPYYK